MFIGCFCFCPQIPVWKEVVTKYYRYFKRFGSSFQRCLCPWGGVLKGRVTLLCWVACKNIPLQILKITHRKWNQNFLHPRSRFYRPRIGQLVATVMYWFICRSASPVIGWITTSILVSPNSFENGSILITRDNQDSLTCCLQGHVVMGTQAPSVYQQVIEKTKGIMSRTQELARNIEKRLNIDKAGYEVS